MAPASRQIRVGMVILIAALSLALARQGVALAKEAEKKRKRSAVHTRTEPHGGGAKPGRMAASKSTRAVPAGKRSDAGRGKATDKKLQALAENRSATGQAATRLGTFTAYTVQAGNKNVTADGTNLLKKPPSSCIVANNALPIGTKVEIEGVGTCQVRDRLGPKAAANHFDIHLKEDPKWAKTFGRRKLKYKIVGSSQAS